jgi:tetratricopeptide (TPR) repeat protein
MNLADSRLKALDDPSLTPDKRVLLRCQLAADLIHAGQYEAAREALGAFWRGVGVRPDVEGLAESLAAEVLLQVGKLSGWLGASQQTPGAQEAAKDLISESAALFERLGEADKAAGAYSNLAICYWREGAYDEARVLLTKVADEATGADAGLRAKVLLIWVAVECAAGRYHDALILLTDYAHIFDESASHALRGSFHSHLAIVLNQLGMTEGRPDYLDRAIIEYTEAIHHFEQARHDRYRANNENNLAFLLYKLGRYKDAHEHLDRASVIVVRLKGAGLLAQFDETRARVLVAEKRYHQAGRVIAGAVQVLEQGGGSAVLADALTTQGVVWARLGDNERSINVLRRAVKVAEESGALTNAGQAALALIEGHGARRVFSQEELYDLYRRADELLTNTQNPEHIARLRACARVVMRRLSGMILHDKNFTLNGAVTELEGKFIEQALDESGGSVTGAARLLGIAHQTLTALLQTRHKRLLRKRTPAKKRRRSIIKKDS